MNDAQVASLGIGFPKNNPSERRNPLQPRTEHPIDPSLRRNSNPLARRSLVITNNYESPSQTSIQTNFLESLHGNLTYETKAESPASAMFSPIVLHGAAHNQLSSVHGRSLAAFAATSAATEEDVSQNYLHQTQPSHVRRSASAHLLIADASQDAHTPFSNAQKAIDPSASQQATLSRILPQRLVAALIHAGVKARSAASFLVSGRTEAAMWLIIYFTFNLSLTIYNKAIMQFYQFPFPWTLTGIHTLCGAVGCQIMASSGFFRPATLSMRENIIMLAFSTLYTVNIAISNVSLGMVSVPFHQTVRAMVPIFTMALELVFFAKLFSPQTIITMIPIIFGVSLATIGDYSFTSLGLVLTLLGTLLAALKGIVTNRVQVGKLKLHPLDLLLRMSPLAFVQTMLYAFITGELSNVSSFIENDMSVTMLFVLIINGIIAFGLNVSSFTANKMTSALTMGVAGNIKQVLSIIISVIVFDISVSITNGIGIILTLIGGALYTRAELLERTKSVSLSTPKPTITTNFRQEKSISNIDSTVSSYQYTPTSQTSAYSTLPSLSAFATQPTHTATENQSPV